MGRSDRDGLLRHNPTEIDQFVMSLSPPRRREAQLVRIFTIPG
jgi:hypothetical protein